MDISSEDLKIESYNPMGGDKNLSIYYEGCIGIKMTHIITGITVQCHSERSQLKNRNKCLELLEEELKKKSLPSRCEQCCHLVNLKCNRVGFKNGAVGVCWMKEEY